MPATVTVKAHANIALVKYWGKSDAATNQPAMDSLSLTLDGLETVTRVEPVRQSVCLSSGDLLILNGKAVSGIPLSRISAFCDLFRKQYADQTRFVIRSENHFPTGAGLASSASAFAALGAALGAFYGIESSPLLANLVRQGSGSAPRSLLPGFVHLHRVAGGIELRQPVTNLTDRIAMLVLVADPRPKTISSRDAMERSRQTSPYWQAWLQTQEADMNSALAALSANDLQALGGTAARNAMAMHALCHTSVPPIYYWVPRTLELLRAVQESSRFAGWVTMDAGPQVKVIVDQEELPTAAAEMAELFPDVQQIAAFPGAGAERIE